MNRRRFLKLTAAGLAGSLFCGGTYPLIEAKWCRVLRVRLRLARLPTAFGGVRIAFLTDVHHGPFVPLCYVEHVVRLTNALRPDLIALGGDYVHRHPRYIEPVFKTLGKLQAPLGRFGVLGNHDHSESAEETRAAMQTNGIDELTNTGVWIRRRGAQLRLCGVGDLWMDHQDLPRALGDMGNDDAAILLAHNPDYVERISDPRVSMVLSGHTHGGQVVVPFAGAPILPSRYGQKYAHGLVQGPTARVFVSRGVGTVTPPVRFRCRPEIVLITLESP